MIQQEMLQYQTLDSELNKIERELKNNPAYLERGKVKATLQKAEEQLYRLDQKAAELRSQLATAGQTLQRIAAVIEEHTKEIADIEDQDELNYMSKKLDEQVEQLNVADKAIKQILREGEEIDKAFETISKQIPRLAAEYNRLGAEFDKATQEVKPRVVELRKKQAELKPAIESQLFEAYQRLSKEVRFPVFVPLQDGNRCGGCRMEMPAAQVSTKIAEKGYMTCEHCGRIIYKTE